MENIVVNFLVQLKRNRSKRRKAAAILVCLSLIVAGSTAWALHINGESQTGETWCGYTEHQHDDSCVEKVLVCGYDTESSTEPESDMGAAASAEAAIEATHVHTDECYEITYICGKEEHQHKLSCFSNPEADVETAADWEKTFDNVELTGDFATDLVAVAETQLGYKESADNYQAVLDSEGSETAETMGYTRYGAWYGMPYEDWCAMFVSFCLNYADITSEMVPYEASCQEWVESLSQLGFYEPVLAEALDEDGSTILVRSDYTPEPGDLVFFDWNEDGAASHVGIVEELEIKEAASSDGTVSYKYIVHIIEGNSSGQVTQREYDLYDEEILGYGSIYSAYLSAVDNGLIENVRCLTAETEDGASFSAIGEIPEDAVLTVSPLTGEQNTYLKENFGLAGSFYDIKIMLADGTEYQPGKAVQIDLSGLGYDARCTLAGYHLTNVSAENLMDVAAADVEVEEVDVNNTGNRVAFEADSFSIYGISEENTGIATFTETTDTDNYPTVDNATAVDKFYLWIYDAVSNGTKVAGYSDFTNNNETGGSITDVLEYTETVDEVTQTYYLIPISYFTNVKDKLTGFSFDESSPGVCPFVYAPDANNNTSNQTAASYVYVEFSSSDETTDGSPKGWYVRVQDTGSNYSPPRSNIYYNPSNSFTLTYGSTALTVNIVDTDGNPIYGDYSAFSKTLNEATKYVFGADLAATQTGTAEKMALPTISGYTYDHAYCNSNQSFEIVSLATKGYQDTNVSQSTASNDFRAYNSEPIVSSGWYSSVSSVTLVYSVTTTDSFTMTYDGSTITFKVVDTDGNAINGVYSDVTAEDGKRYIFGAPSGESHDENEEGDNKDKVEWNAAPDIDGYLYQRAYIGGTSADDTANNAVFSLATKGYKDSLSNSGEITHLRLYKTEPMQTGEYTDVTAGDNLTITLVYKVKTDHFTLTLKNDDTEIAALTVYVVDLSGNPISGDYQDYNQDLNVNTKYLFDPADSETGAINLNIPEIDGYTYYRTCYTSKNDHPVVSVVTQGYTLGADQGTLGNAFRFYNPGGTDANGGYHTCNSANIYLVYSTPMHVVTDIANANSTAVNLFDYWCTTTRDGSDYHQSDDSAGINAGHALKFHYSSSEAVGNFNRWTGSGGGVLQGIVSGKLSSGFPTLSGNTNLGMTKDNTESLAYLFDPSVKNDYKASYRNVQGLFQINSGGYYYYNSKENFAEFDEETNRFTLYEEAGVADSDTNENGMFFPFNTIEEAYPLSSGENATLNHYFGMALTTRFIQSYDGYTDASRSTATSFRFAGDDDVWIFIDDVLVADLGGIHDATGVTIDFAAGTVVINTVYGANSNPVTTQFSEIFADTGVQLGTYTNPNDSKNYITLANNTTHTLKFFYLERGNAASNLYLEYNLNEIPDTAIYKVDQYGDPLEGATFAVYQSNENGEYKVTITDENGTETTTYISLAGCTQVYSKEEVVNNTYYIDLTANENGNIQPDITANVNGTVYTIKAAYHGTTDSQGEMPFVDGDYMPYSASELKDMFGEYFILREVDVPDGYRTVEDEILLQFQGELLQSVYPYGTGVWASPNALVTATNTLHVADGYGNADSGLATGAAINYYDPTTGKTNGTLFAVVLKRNVGNTEIVTTEDVPTWQPVYGNDEDGYEVVSFEAEETGKNQLKAVIEAAKKAENYGNVEFGYSASGMQVLLKNLPGSATRYYTYMKDNNKEFTTTDPQYLIAYYYTTADVSANGWESVTVDNTVRIRSHGQTSTEGETYDAFTIQWGADIEVPNIENRLFFQKQDASGADGTSTSFIDNAVFALYPVTEGKLNDAGNPDVVTTANYYYTATASDGSTAYVQLDVDADGKTSYGTALVYTTSNDKTITTTGTYTIQSGSNQSGGYITDSGAGDITVETENGTYTIKPATNAAGTSMVGYTHDNCDFVSEEGTGHFRQLLNGTYILREIEAPAGYAVNPEEIKVLVSDTAVYANAGTKDNGVAVGNGVGYVVRTLDVFAAEGTIDESLTWIYSVLRVNPDNDSFAGVSVENKPYYVMQDGEELDGYGSGITEKLSEAMVTYLKYVGSKDDKSLFDYIQNEDQSARKAETNESDNGDEDDENKALVGNLGNKGVATLRGEGTLRLYTTAGWSGLEVYQDYAYGYSQATTNNTTAYSDLSGQNLTHLYSNSTFVRVTDEYSAGNLEIRKTVLPADELQAFTFNLTLSKGDGMITNLADSYTYTVYDISTEDGVEKRTVAKITEDGTKKDYTGKITITSTKSTDDEGNTVVTSQTGATTITLKNNQIVVIEDLPYGTAYSVTETLNGGTNALPYTTWISVNDGDSVEDTKTNGTLLWTEDLNEDNVWRVDYTNALLPLVQLVKVDGLDNGIHLAGATFVMYRVVKETDNDGNTVTVTEYYSSDNGKWQKLLDGKTESDYAMITGGNGELMVANMNKAGTYYLKELAAPDGYNLLTEIIEFEVTYDETSGKLKITSPGTDTQTAIYEVTNLAEDGQQLNMNVINNPGYELPKTGGTGIIMFTAGGLLLIAVTLVYGCGLRRKRERRAK